MLPIGLALMLFITTDDSGVPRLTELDESQNAAARNAPVVLVGVTYNDARVGHRVPSRVDPAYPMQMHRVSIRVENVLRGSVSGGTISVFYFGFGGGLDGPRPLGFSRGGSRRILWIRRDHGVYRMACDGWDACTMFVESGAHPRYRRPSGEPLAQAIADILLTRGEGEINNLRFASEIRWGVPDSGIQGFVIEKLHHLTAEPDPVRTSACEQLWIYTRDRIGEELRRKAEDYLQAAHCACGELDGRLSCQ